jgi:hypothetical protein
MLLVTAWTFSAGHVVVGYALGGHSRSSRFSWPRRISVFRR